MSGSPEKKPIASALENLFGGGAGGGGQAAPMPRQRLGLAGRPRPMSMHGRVSVDKGPPPLMGMINPFTGLPPTPTVTEEEEEPAPAPTDAVFGVRETRLLDTGAARDKRSASVSHKRRPPSRKVVRGKRLESINETRQAVLEARNRAQTSAKLTLARAGPSGETSTDPSPLGGASAKAEGSLAMPTPSPEASSNPFADPPLAGETAAAPVLAEAEAGAEAEAEAEAGAEAEAEAEAGAEAEAEAGAEAEAEAEAASGAPTEAGPGAEEAETEAAAPKPKPKPKARGMGFNFGKINPLKAKLKSTKDAKPPLVSKRSSFLLDKPVITWTKEEVRAGGRGGVARGAPHVFPFWSGHRCLSGCGAFTRVNWPSTRRPFSRRRLRAPS